MTQHNNDWGDIPLGWEICKISDIAKITTGNKNTQDKVNNGAYPFFVRSQIIERINSYSFDGEAVLTAGDGVGVGKIFHYINGKFDYHQRVYAITNFDDSVDAFYFYKYFENRFYQRIIQMTAKSSVDSVRMEFIADMSIPLPPKPEQTAIATVLSDTDKLIDSLSALIAKKQAIKSATMSQLLSGQKRLTQFANHLDGTPKTYIQTDNGKIPEDWEVVKLGDLATFLKGNGLPKKDIQEFGKYPAVHYGELFINYKEKIDKVISFTDIDCPIKSVKNDVLMPTSDVTPNGLATASCIQLDNVILGGDILVIRIPFEKMNGVFLAYFIRFNKENILKKVKGTTVFHLYAKDMAELKISIPKSTTEQTAIAQILVDMDSDIVALEHRLTKTKALKQGLMHQLLTGKIRLI